MKTFIKLPVGAGAHAVVVDIARVEIAVVGHIVVVAGIAHAETVAGHMPAGVDVVDHTEPTL